MALPTSTFATYQAVGDREDLSDMIYRIDPTDTPFMSGAEKEKASAVNHEWQIQALDVPNAANAQLEGDDPTTNDTTPTVRLGIDAIIDARAKAVSKESPGVPFGVIRNLLTARAPTCRCAQYLEIATKE